MITPSFPPTLVLFSGWQTINIGDVGHTPGTLRYLEQHLPEATLRVVLSVTNEAVTSMLQRRFPRVRFFHPQETELALEGADMVLENSGMKYNRFWPNDGALMRRCIDRKIPFGLYGQSFDGFQPDQVGLFQELLGQAALVSCRDSHSLGYLRGLGIQPGTLEFGPDGCFGIDVRDDVRAEAFLKDQGLEVDQFVAVVLRSYTPKHGGKDEVLNPVRPTAEQQATEERWAQTLREVIAHLMQTTDLKVALVPEVDKEIPAAKRLIWDHLPDRWKPRVVHRAHFWNVDEANSFFSRSRALVAMEPHSCIVALSTGTPILHTFSPVHGCKAQMFADLGLADWLINIDQVGSPQVIAPLDRILAEPARARARAQGAMDRADTLAASMMAQVRRVLNLIS